MFISFFANSDNRDPTDDFWFKDIGLGTFSKQRVNVETALSLTAVWSCVHLLAETIGHLPLPIYRQDGDSKFAQRQHKLWRLLNFQPNRWQTAIEWRMMMQGHFELRGAGRSEIIFDQFGDVAELLPLHPDKVQPEIINGGKDWHYIVKDDNGVERILTRDRVFEVKGLSLDAINPLNPIEAEREALGYALGAQEYGSTFYGNGATPTGYLSAPPGIKKLFEDENQKRAFQKSWQSANTGKNRFKTPILEKGMEYHELGIKHTDMQYLETRQYTVVDVCRIFRVPPHKLGEMDGAKFNNVEQQNIDFVTSAIAPRATMWEQAIYGLFNADEQKDHYAKIKLQALMRGDMAARASSQDIGIKNGSLTRNEARGLEDRNPLPGLDEPLTPMNMAESAGGSNNARAAMMLETNAERCVTGLCNQVERAINDVDDLQVWSKGYFEKHAKWVSTVMCLPIEHADNYCIDLELQLFAADDTSALIDQWRATGKQTILSMVNEVDNEKAITA